MKTVILAALLSSVAWPCHAALIEVAQGRVTIDGDIGPNDFAVFKAKTSPLSQAVVVIRSNGGKVLPAIQIGEMVRMKGFATYVGEYCLSACALLWLGGTQRYMAATAQIGFHAAYNETGHEIGMANAVVGAYLTKIGLPYEAVMYATVAAPNSMKYLTAADAKRVGIDVNIINPDATLAQPALKPPSLQDRALSFVSYYFANLSSDDYPEVFAELYWNSANYYGRMTSKQDILADKLRFRKQWPARSYKLRSAAATCGLTECNVTGIVDWEVSSQTKRSTGSAAFEYVLRPWPQGGAGTNAKLRISAENGKILQRQIADQNQSP
jgi:ATP-dependent protease ClpP protease subunit